MHWRSTVTYRVIVKALLEEMSNYQEEKIDEGQCESKAREIVQYQESFHYYEVKVQFVEKESRYNCQYHYSDDEEASIIDQSVAFDMILCLCFSSKMGTIPNP